jgi:hypothetical protein
VQTAEITDSPAHELFPVRHLGHVGCDEDALRARGAKVLRYSMETTAISSWYILHEYWASNVLCPCLIDIGNYHMCSLSME